MHPPSSMDSLFASMLGGMSNTILETLAPLIQSQITKEVSEIKTHMVEKPMSVKEAAEYLGIAQPTLYEWISKGVLPSVVCHKVNGQRYFFFPSELQQFIKKS